MTRTEALDLRKKVVDGETHEALRPYIEKAAASLDDNDAANAVKLFPTWTVGIAVSVGERYQYADKLYKVVQAHTTQADWTPDATPAMWAVIDKTHAGTLEDPIPASRGMEYEYGKYYLDGEDGNTYLCQRTGEAAGGTIVLQYMPHELVGQYFEAVTETKLEELTREVREHNNFARRVPVVEEQIKVINHRLEDLEHESGE